MKKIIIITMVLVFLVAVAGFFINLNKVNHRNKVRNNLLSYVGKVKKTTPLHLAVNLGEVALVEELLTKKLLYIDDVNINEGDGDDITPLESAIRFDYYGFLDQFFKPKIKIIKLLIEHGADVNANGGGPLQEAVHLRNPEIVELLIQSGADVNKQNKDGWTPLHSAIVFRHKDIIKMLLDAGAREDIKDKEGRTPSDVKNIIGGD